MENRDVYFAGDQLYGDDFTLEQIEKWYEDEKEGYAELVTNEKSTFIYSYHALNVRHGFRHLSQGTFESVLGVGSAYGDEFLPIVKQIGQLTILDPSDAFVQNEVHGVPCNYVRPRPDGRMPFESESFDLVTCLGVLHHIPNVTFLAREIYRCLAHDGFALIREPIVSMGDWSKPRVGLTKREPGIPLKVFHRIIREAGFQVVSETLVAFPLIPKLADRLNIVAYNNRFLTWLDAQVCRLLSADVRYHADRFIHKFRPTAVYFVLKKSGDREPITR
jgi:SAM-dependent methyltransferase